MSRENPRMRLPEIKKLGRKAVFLWAACMLVLLSGCWDLRYLDKLGVVLAMGVDDDPSGKQKLRLTVQVVLPQNVASESKGGTGGAPVTSFTETGDTIFEAIRKMSAKTSRRLFFSHTQMLIVGEKMARKGIFPLVDLIERNPDIRTDILVVVTRGVRAEQLLQVTTQMESIPVYQFHDMVDVNQESYAMNYAVLVKDLTRLTGKGKQQAVLPSIRIEGDKAAGNTVDNLKTIPAEAIPVLSTMAVFRNGKLVDYLKPKESRGLAWLQNKVKNTVIKLACPETKGNLIIEVNKASMQYKVKQSKDGMPIIQAKLELTGSIQEIMCPGIDVLDERVLNEIGELTSQAVKKEVEETIRKMQKNWRVDALGWGKEVYLQQPDVWKRIEKDWETVFPEVQHEVICITKIMGSGVRSKSIVK